MKAEPVVGEHNNIQVLLAGAGLAAGICHHLANGDVEMAFVVGVQVPVVGVGLAVGRSSHFVAGIVNVTSHYSL